MCVFIVVLIMLKSKSAAADESSTRMPPSPEESFWKERVGMLVVSWGGMRRYGEVSVSTRWAIEMEERRRLESLKIKQAGRDAICYTCSAMICYAMPLFKI